MPRRSTSIRSAPRGSPDSTRSSMEGGLYFVAWWDNSTKFVATKPVTASDDRLNATSPNYDIRFASSVSLIPEGEIDRTDRSVFNPESSRGQPATETVAQINAKLCRGTIVPSP